MLWMSSLLHIGSPGDLTEETVYCCMQPPSAVPHISIVWKCDLSLWLWLVNGNLFVCSYPSFQTWPLAPNSLLAVRVGGPSGSTSVRAEASPHEVRTCQDTTKTWLTGHWWARWELPWARPGWLSSRTRWTITHSTSSAGATLGRSCRLSPPTQRQGSRSWRRQRGDQSQISSEAQRSVYKLLSNFHIYIYIYIFVDYMWFGYSDPLFYILTGT